ncbi:MAG: hypothetical protein AB1898_19300 [Acidobacteriota bacterium]
MNNLDFSTLYLISVPGFIVGVVTGRFLSSGRWKALKAALGVVGKLISALSYLVFLAASLIVLGIMVVYLWNLPDNAPAANFWVTLMVGVWMLVNLIVEIREFSTSRGRRGGPYSV